MTIAAASCLVASVSLAQRVPCTTVLAELHRVERRGGLRGGDPGRIAKVLGTSPAWVEKCAAVYGRRMQSDLESQRRAEALERVWEEHEPEEVAREELVTEGDVVQAPAPYSDKARQRAFSMRRQDWEPYEHRPWGPNTGRQWSPYTVDRHRELPDDVPGIIRY